LHKDFTEIPSGEALHQRATQVSKDDALQARARARKILHKPQAHLAALDALALLHCNAKSLRCLMSQRHCALVQAADAHREHQLIQLVVRQAVSNFGQASHHMLLPSPIHQFLEMLNGAHHAAEEFC
jgi:hypothetical protein